MVWLYSSQLLITQVVYTVSPKTKTSHVSHIHSGNKTKISSWRHSSLLDSFTPAWKRFSTFDHLFSFYCSILLEEATTCLTSTAREIIRPR